MKHITYPPHSLSRRDLFKVGLLGAGGTILAPALNMIEPRDAHAAYKTLDPNDGLVETGNRLKLYPKNCTYKWCTRSGRVYEGSSGLYFFAPVTNKNGNFRINDLLDLSYSGCFISGREVVVKIHIDRFQVGTQKSPSATKPLPSYFCIASNRSSSTFLFQQNPSATFGGAYDSYCSCKWRWYLYYTITITWKDTGKVVDLPFYQFINDIDAGGNSSYYRESWTGDSGFDGGYYVYSKHRLKISGSTFSTPDNVGNLSGNDSTIKGGVYAATTKGKFSGHYQLGDCGNDLYICSPLLSIDEPLKEFSISS